MAIIATWIITNSDEHLRADLLKLVGAEGRMAFLEAALTYVGLQFDGAELAQNPVLDELWVDLAPLSEQLADKAYPIPWHRHCWVHSVGTPRLRQPGSAALAWG